MSMRSSLQLVQGKDRHTEQNQDGRERSDDCGVTTLFHNSVNNGDRETSEDRRESTHADIGHVVESIVVANVFESKFTVKAHKPAR